MLYNVIKSKSYVNLKVNVIKKLIRLKPTRILLDINKKNVLWEFLSIKKPINRFVAANFEVEKKN